MGFLAILRHLLRARSRDQFYWLPSWYAEGKLLCVCGLDARRPNDYDGTVNGL
jgi:hypothetical protein